MSKNGALKRLLVLQDRAMDLVEQRSMFTMWAALPGPLILSADLRSASMGAHCCNLLPFLADFRCISER
jgi:hypothetical protein